VIVVDANVAIKWVVDQTHFEQAREIVARGIALAVPTLFVAEITSTLWKYARTKELAAKQAREGVASILRQISLFERDATLAEEALAIGTVLNCSPYDCFYLVLAMRRGLPFVTADRRFINRLATTPYKASVVHLADWT